MSTFRRSPFILVRPLDDKEFIFSTQTQRVYAFSSRLDDILRVANSDFSLQEKIGQIGLISYRDSYCGAVNEFEARKHEKNKESLQICYSVTTRCNLHCKYCFQNHITRADTTVEMIERTALLLDKTLTDNKEIKRVVLYLFGGDPMIRTDLCLNLLRTIGNICKHRGVDLSSVMATNGIIGDYDTYRCLREAGLNRLQVSFDGPREIHNRTRTNTYSIIMENIPMLSTLFALSIKYNISKENVDKFTEFLRDIGSIRFSQPYVVTLEALTGTLTYNDEVHLYDYEDSALAKSILTLGHLCAQNNIPYDISTCFQPPCMATSDRSFMLEPDGYVSRCISSYCIESFRIGHLFDLNNLDVREDDINLLIEKAASELCCEKECPFFPICETGCLYKKYLRGIGPASPLCRYEFYLTLANGLIEQKMMEGEGVRHERDSEGPKRSH